MERKSGIYMWTSPSGKSYIGQSVNLQKRKCAFLCFGDIYGGEKINRARKKYNHKSLWNYTILEYCDIDDLDEREEYYISLYNTINNGYNCESGGHENKIVSDESKQKMSDAKKGKHLTEEQKRKMSEARKGKRCGENHPMWGRHLTEEQKRKMSKAKKGENNPMYGKHRDDETKDKIRLRRNKAVVQYTKEGEFIAEYESALIAKEKTGINNSHIGDCCRGIQKTAGGFKWAYKNPPLLKKNEGLNKN